MRLGSDTIGGFGEFDRHFDGEMVARAQWRGSRRSPGAVFGSERRRQTNPRKLYVADHGLARAYAANSGLDRGRMLENIVAGALKWLEVSTGWRWLLEQS